MRIIYGVLGLVLCAFFAWSILYGNPPAPTEREAWFREQWRLSLPSDVWSW